MVWWNMIIWTMSNVWKDWQEDSFLTEISNKHAMHNNMRIYVYMYIHTGLYRNIQDMTGNFQAVKGPSWFFTKGSRGLFSSALKRCNATTAASGTRGTGGTTTWENLVSGLVALHQADPWKTTCKGIEREGTVSPTCENREMAFRNL